MTHEIYRVRKAGQWRIEDDLIPIERESDGHVIAWVRAGNAGEDRAARFAGVNDLFSVVESLVEVSELEDAAERERLMAIVVNEARTAYAKAHGEVAV
jgi:hypothetical protein